MSLDQFAPIQVVLAAAAPELPNFGVSVIAGELSSQQLAKFFDLSGSLSTVRITPSSFIDTLEAIGLSSVDLQWIDTVDHFGGNRKPEEAFLTYRGRADQTHIQTLTLSPETGSSTQARIGVYRLDNIEGGPYIHNSVGAAQVTTLTIEDAGGGDGANGRYEVSDNAGNLYIYEAGGINLWTFVVLSAAVGVYTVTAEGVVYTYTADALDTVQTIRDGLLADMNNLLAHPGGHPEWISNTSGTDTITLTASEVGFQLTVVSNLGPGATEATITETTPLVPETLISIATAIQAVIVAASPPPPVEWTSVDAAGVITATALAAFIGQDLGVKIAGPTSSDATTLITVDHRETVVSVLTVLDGLLTAAVHPTFANSLASPVITLTGLVAGVAIGVDVTSPSGSLVLQETQSILTLRTSQVQRVTIVAQTGTAAYVGIYTLSLLGTNLMHTAVAPDTITDVRDALMASVDLNLATETSTVAVGTDAFDITITEQGLPVVVTITSPASNAGANTNLQIASYGAVDDFDRAVVDEPDWYFWVGRGTDTDIKALTLHIDDIAPQTPRRQFALTNDSTIPDTPTATATDIGQVVKDTGTLRTTVFWDPVPSSSVQDQQGMHAQWVGIASTFLPGQVQWNLTILDGVTGGQKLSGLQEGNMRDKAVVFGERIGSLGSEGEIVTNGPYTPEGRQIDIARALDQIKSVYQINAVALLANNAIIPYNEQGISLINDMIQQTTRNLVIQGLVIDNSFLYLPDGQIPEIADASQSDREQGIFPTFEFQLIIQVGGVEIPMVIQVTQ